MRLRDVGNPFARSRYTQQLTSASFDSPYLLMEVRDMLADDGMLYDDVCLGTKATTQRSDTCEQP